MFIVVSVVGYHWHWPTS